MCVAKIERRGLKQRTERGGGQIDKRESSRERERERQRQRDRQRRERERERKKE